MPEKEKSKEIAMKFYHFIIGLSRDLAEDVTWLLMTKNSRAGTRCMSLLSSPSDRISQT